MAVFLTGNFNGLFPKSLASTNKFVLIVRGSYSQKARKHKFLNEVLPGHSMEWNYHK